MPNGEAHDTYSGHLGNALQLLGQALERVESYVIALEEEGARVTAEGRAHLAPRETLEAFRRIHEEIRAASRRVEEARTLEGRLARTPRVVAAAPVSPDGIVAFLEDGSAYRYDYGAGRVGGLGNWREIQPVPFTAAWVKGRLSVGVENPGEG